MVADLSGRRKLGSQQLSAIVLLCALIGKLAGIDNLFAGRALSLVALASIAVEIFAAVRLLAGGSLGATVGALWYLAIMARNSTVYIGTNDPQLAGLAIMGAGLVYFLSLCRRDRSPIPALLLMVAAGFWKHNNIAIPLAAIVWLFIDRNRQAYWATLAVGAAAALGLAACAALFGLDLFHNLLANRNYAWSNVLGNIGHLQWPALALLFWVAWAWGIERGEVYRAAYRAGSFRVYPAMVRPWRERKRRI